MKLFLLFYYLFTLKIILSDNLSNGLLTLSYDIIEEYINNNNIDLLIISNVDDRIISPNVIYIDLNSKINKEISKKYVVFHPGLLGCDQCDENNIFGGLIHRDIGQCNLFYIFK